MEFELPSKKTTQHIGVIGDGGWGTTLAIHLAKKNIPVKLWSFDCVYANEMATSRENAKFLPGVHIPEKIMVTSSCSELVSNCRLVICAVPSKYFRQTLNIFPSKDLRKIPMLIASKGIETDTLSLLSQVAKQVLGRARIAVLSGPCISREIVAEVPSAAVIAASSRADREFMRKLINAPYFRILESADVNGLQVGGAVKNVLAIAAGVVDGLGYGVNTKSVLLSRGIEEMIRLGKHMKAKTHTFMGLSGLGDLTTTSFSSHSRNHHCGSELGKGLKLKKILRQSEMVVEGVDTALSVEKLRRKHKIKLPICHAVYKILYKQGRPREVVEAMMVGKTHTEEFV